MKLQDIVKGKSYAPVMEYVNTNNGVQLFSDKFVEKKVNNVYKEACILCNIINDAMESSEPVYWTTLCDQAIGYKFFYTIAKVNGKNEVVKCIPGNRNTILIQLNGEVSVAKAEEGDLIFWHEDEAEYYLKIQSFFESKVEPLLKKISMNLTNITTADLIKIDQYQAKLQSLLSAL